MRFQKQDLKIIIFWKIEHSVYDDGFLMRADDCFPKFRRGFRDAVVAVRRLEIITKVVGRAANRKDGIWLADE